MIILKKTLYRITLILLILIFLLSGYHLFTYFYEGKKSENRYDELAAMVDQARPAETTQPEEPEDTAPAGTEPDAEAVTEPEIEILPEYEALLEYNPDLVGWISIEKTKIDYPVVQTPNQPEYYLHRDFDGDANDRGCLFVDAGCDVTDSDNVIIYGHHMSDGSMFASLINYDNEYYWQSHPEIRFDTLTEHRTYEVFAVFRTTATVGQGFPYHRFIDAEDEEAFDEFVAKCKELSPIDSGITPEYGDKLICLSTCEYSRENGRYVVMGVYRPK